MPKKLVDRHPDSGPWAGKTLHWSDLLNPVPGGPFDPRHERDTRDRRKAIVLSVGSKVQIHK